MEQKLAALKLKKARQFSDIESLSEVSDSAYLQFGKTVVQIMKLEKQLVRETKNHINEN